ncbi:MAG: 2-hydroxychromene-2-carboxylate isomerase [Burkholderiales bacterium]|nr:2-hydroxychromene-2-carboxylate isomerase [Burkholderiales bacterium]
MPDHPSATPELSTIEFWFDLSSNYSYLSVMRIEAAAAAHGKRVIWRPFLLGPVFKALGWADAPFILQKEKGEYVWHDMVRLCRKYGLPWVKPSSFPRRALLPTRVALIGCDREWGPAFCKQIMQLNFAEDRDVDSVDVVEDVLNELGLPALDLIGAAESHQNKLLLRERTELARRKAIFGAPTFFVGSEMFWGNDRLDDALTFTPA